MNYITRGSWNNGICGTVNGFTTKHNAITNCKARMYLLKHRVNFLHGDMLAYAVSADGTETVVAGYKCSRDDNYYMHRLTAAEIHLENTFQEIA